MVVVPADGLSTSDAYRATKAVLQPHEHTGSVLIAAGADAYAIGSGRAASKAGIGQDAAVIGMGGGYAGRIQMLRGETLRAAVASFPETYGDRILSLALRILQGEAVPRVHYTEHVLLTPGNVRQYYPGSPRRGPRSTRQPAGRSNAIACAG